tara:strand:- start:9458 stop:10648 length:1191 start_codon:yes stop_codon:yes gene_type:complete
MARFLVFLAIFLISCNPFKEDGETNSSFCAHSPEICDGPSDSEAPTINSISTPADGVYEAGDTIEFDISFSEEINLSGTFALVLDIGRHQKSSICSKQNATTIRCSYTFEEASIDPDLDFDGIAFNSLDASSATIQDAAGNNANLSVAAPDLSGIMVYYTNFDYWLDATDADTVFSNAACSVPINDGDDVGCWVDKRSGFNVTNGGGGKPSYDDNIGPNNTAAIYFNSEFLSYSTSPTIQSNFTLLVVYNIVGFNTLNYFIGSISNTTAGIGFGFGGSWTGGPAGDGIYVLTKATAGSPTDQFVSTLEPTAWGLNTYQPTKIFRNQSEALPYSNVVALSLPQSFTRIGGRDDGNTCCNNNGNISEIMIFNQTLNDEQLEEIWCHISDKYAFGFAGC